jgi:IS5 family transposase
MTLHSQESVVHGDGATQGCKGAPEVRRRRLGPAGPKDRLTHAMKRAHFKAMPEVPAKAMHEWFERRKAHIRVIVEHPFHVIHSLFGYREVSYHGIDSDNARVWANCSTSTCNSLRKFQRTGAESLGGVRVWGAPIQCRSQLVFRNGSTLALLPL